MAGSLRGLAVLAIGIVGCSGPAVRLRVLDAKTNEPVPGVSVSEDIVMWQPHIPLCIPVKCRFQGREVGTTDVTGTFESRGAFEGSLTHPGYKLASIKPPSRSACTPWPSS